MQQNAKYPCQPMNHKGVGVVVSRCVENEWGKKTTLCANGRRPTLSNNPLLRTSDNNRKPIIRNIGKRQKTIENHRTPRNTHRKP